MDKLIEELTKLIVVARQVLEKQIGHVELAAPENPVPAPAPRKTRKAKEEVLEAIEAKPAPEKEEPVAVPAKKEEPKAAVAAIDEDAAREKALSVTKIFMTRFDKEARPMAKKILEDNFKLTKMSELTTPQLVEFTSILEGKLEKAA